ncbi:MAG: acyl-CoA dehydrogenase family protein [Dehalococcoidia bacterium]
MRFEFTPQQQAFRQEVRQFFADFGAVPGAGGMSRGEDPERARELENQLSRRGWMTMGWPKEYGGRGADQILQMIFREEAATVGAPGGTMGTSVIGPAIMVHGTEEQKKRFLPAITSNSIRWCQGYSEPGSGSDLASLQTRAVRDGDDYVINGQKIWTSGAWASDWIHILVRTDPDAPKHRGISYFLMDMKTPGISVRRITHLTGEAELCETFYDNVRVPASQMLGPENRGWYVATTALDFERSGIDRLVTAQRTLNEIVDFAKGEKRWHAADRPTGGASHRRHADRHQRRPVVSYRVAWMQARGLIPNYESSMSKMYGSEMNQYVANLGTYVLGLKGQLYRGSKYAPNNASVAFAYLHAVQATILAGTSQIQRNIIATRGLGLPRG